MPLPGSMKLKPDIVPAPGKGMGRHSRSRSKDLRDHHANSRVRDGSIKALAVKQLRRTRSVEMKKGSTDWLGEGYGRK